MNTLACKKQVIKSKSAANNVAHQVSDDYKFQFKDNDPELITQRKLQEIVDNSSQVRRLMTFQDMANKSPQVKFAAQLQTMTNNSSVGGVDGYRWPSSVREPIQLVKNEDERRQKQRRVARARRTIAQVAPNFNNNMSGHLFDGLPANGGALDVNNPEGLHCYRNGRLPGGINIRSVNGSTSKVHTINWDWNGNNPKDSTMFPDWLSENNVKTIIGLQYPDLVGGLPDQAFPDNTRTYITRGYEFTFGRHGDTVYPD